MKRLNILTFAPKPKHFLSDTLHMSLAKLAIGISVLSASLVAGETRITLLDVTPGDSEYQKNVTIQVMDNNRNPLTNGAIAMNPSNAMYMYAMDLTNIVDGEYTVSVRLTNDCEENKIYHENVVLRALRTQDNISNNVISIPVEFDCTGNNDNIHFETEHPYANNTHTTSELPAICPPGECIIDPGSHAYARIEGETERNYDFITISQGGQVIERLSGEINTQIAIDGTLPTTITFDSDDIITKNGVTVDLSIEQNLPNQ